jgi:hypothetical protein
MNISPSSTHQTRSLFAPPVESQVTANVDQQQEDSRQSSFVSSHQSLPTFNIPPALPGRQANLPSAPRQAHSALNMNISAGSSLPTSHDTAVSSTASHSGPTLQRQLEVKREKNLDRRCLGPHVAEYLKTQAAATFLLTAGGLALEATSIVLFKNHQSNQLAGAVVTSALGLAFLSVGGLMARRNIHGYRHHKIEAELERILKSQAGTETTSSAV